MDRISLPRVLKTEGNYKVLILNRDINKKIELSQDELVKCNYRTSPADKEGRVMSMWDEFDAEIEFTELESAEIKERLVELDSQNKLTSEIVHLYELFCL